MWLADMMIDWVSSRPAGDAAAHSFQAVRAIPEKGLIVG
jgi:hypothetical protein